MNMNRSLRVFRAMKKIGQMMNYGNFIHKKSVTWSIPNLDPSLKLTKPTCLKRKKIKKMADAERCKANPTPDQPKTVEDTEDENGHLFLQHECSKQAKQKFFVFDTDDKVGSNLLPQY